MKADSGERELRHHRFYGFRYEHLLVKDQPLKESKPPDFFMCLSQTPTQAEADSKVLQTSESCFLISKTTDNINLKSHQRQS